MVEMPHPPLPPADSLSDYSYSDDEEPVEVPHLVNYGLTDGVEWPQPKPEGALTPPPSDFSTTWLEEVGAALHLTPPNMHENGRRVPEIALNAANRPLSIVMTSLASAHAVCRTIALQRIWTAARAF